jgi:hypothetical protein
MCNILIKTLIHPFSTKPAGGTHSSHVSTKYGAARHQMPRLLQELIAAHNGFEWLIWAMRLAISLG